MADVETMAPVEQADIELPNGVVMSGMGGDTEAMRLTFEERHEELQPSKPDDDKPIETAAVQEKPKPLRGQARFDALTAERETEKRRADAAEARAKDLEAKLAAPPQPAAREEPKPAVVEPTRRAKPLAADVGTKYPTYEDFVEDLSDWKAEQRITSTVQDLDARSTARIEADRASRSRADLANSAFARGRTAYPDFDAVLKSVDDILISPAHQQAIMSVPDFEHVMYGLAKDRNLLQAVLKIQNPVQFGIELAKILPSAAVASPASTAPVVRSTNAPAPVQPVGSGSRTTSPSLDELAERAGEDFDNSGYRERRAREQGRKPVR